MFSILTFPTDRYFQPPLNHSDRLPKPESNPTASNPKKYYTSTLLSLAPSWLNYKNNINTKNCIKVADAIPYSICRTQSLIHTKCLLSVVNTAAYDSTFNKNVGRITLRLTANTILTLDWINKVHCCSTTINHFTNIIVFQ